MKRLFFVVSILFFLFGGVCIGTSVADPGTNQPVALSSLVRVVVGTSDRMTSVLTTEAQNYTMEGQIFYLLGPDTTISGTSPVYRLYNNYNDHMDSLSTNEGGYVSGGTLGKGWTSSSAQAGVSADVRAYKASTNDHMNHHTYESLPAGYTDEGTMIYGFRRYNNTDTSLVGVSGGGITANANLVAGASVWEWWWNGKQFLNDYDCGRQLQVALQVPSLYYDTSECGDLNYNQSNEPWKRHGSPVVSYSASVGILQSSTIPLDYGNQYSNHWGTSQDTPNLWLNWRLGKEITLNFNGMGPVAKFKANVTAAQTVTNEGVLEFPMIYLPSSFNRFWTYNAASNSLTEVTSSMPDGCSSGAPGYTFTPNYGGVIISDSTQGYAIGIYAGNRSVGGAANYFAMWKFWCSGDGSGQYKNDTSKLDVVYGNSASIPSGQSSYTSYVINGTVQNVANRMGQLYLSGYK